MPLPSSGQISISQIRTELGTSNGSLRALSSLAGFSTPDAMSEFYGYASESMNGQVSTALDAYQSFGDWYCGCIEVITVYQTTAGRWLRGNSIGSTPLAGTFNLDGQIYSFSNGTPGGSLGSCSVIC
jgi:hypothetical protein